MTTESEALRINSAGGVHHDRACHQYRDRDDHVAMAALRVSND